MKINFVVKADLINSAEKTYLKSKLRATDDTIEEILNDIAKSSFYEYITMLK